MSNDPGLVSLSGEDVEGVLRIPGSLLALAFEAAPGGLPGFLESEREEELPAVAAAGKVLDGNGIER